ncbi:MAG TPA: hypothetical protein VHG93_25600 [Longimicrobium sp.]|nr:hypothetical protein [Longimicrobium sp.]
MPSHRPTPLQGLDRLHARVRGSAVLYRFTLANRILLAVGFIPTGMIKVLGRPFTRMDPASDVGAFFDVLYRSGPYWRFIGAAQVVAGLLMLMPRTATLGAVIFAPVIANIFVITLAYDFNGTPVITGMMLLATVYLLCWDWHRLRGLVFDAPPAAAPLPVHRLRTAEFAVYAVGTVAAMAFFASMRGLVPHALGWAGFVVAGVAALVALGWLFIAAREAKKARAAT